MTICRSSKGPHFMFSLFFPNFQYISVAFLQREAACLSVLCYITSIYIAFCGKRKDYFLLAHYPCDIFKLRQVTNLVADCS